MYVTHIFLDQSKGNGRLSTHVEINEKHVFHAFNVCWNNVYKVILCLI